MYPTISDLIKDIFGVYIPLPVQSFGFFVAIAFIVAAWLLLLELRRKENEGIIFSLKKNVMIGKPASKQELFWMALFGFIIGYKLLGIIFNYKTFVENPQQFMFSGEGNFFAGIVGAFAMAYYRYYEKQKTKLDKPRLEEVEVHPYELTGNIIMLGAVFGILGSKLFDMLENVENFQSIGNFIKALFSFSGLAFYGGLICAAIAIILYARKNKIRPLVICDIAAPAIMIAYAIGRIGCQTAGDGDWGILNSAYITTPESKVELADDSAFIKTLEENKTYYFYEFKTDSLKNIPHITVKAPGFIPNWMVAYPYPNNVNDQGVETKFLYNKNQKHFSQLPIPVFPTPFYETVVCSLFFIVLWLIRKRIKISGILFSIFLIMNGFERFFIEKIRVNIKYHILDWNVTQAEIISMMLIITGIILLVYILKNKKNIGEEKLNS
ncbi:MAG TPA: prolipoprotein diacylglyceryl transferase [Bacteroidales bacterium]|nr:prolipoprotein diacylglyceryl transferase [Bacteroidales bacterium]HPS17688.1 prolipoprotein diacylglyceryl transferase [Bacteroidales bacterium]